MMDHKNKDELYLNDFAIRNLREIADQDYITARVCYKNGLMLQFYWSSLQAIEKYFKSILLFHRISSKDFGHDLNKLYAAIANIETLDFTLTTKQEQFLNLADDQGNNRYLTMPTYFKGFEIVDLDEIVWAIRGYCRTEVTFQAPDERREAILRSLKSSLTSRSQITIPGGYLEKVIDNKKSLQRSALIWNNLFFGRKRKSIKLIRHWGATNPPQTLYPEVIDKLFELVYFPKQEKELFRQHRSAMRKQNK